MDVSLRKDADAIISASLRAVLPDKAVRRALQTFQPRGGRVVLVAAGKAAWQMARAAVETLGRVDSGVVITASHNPREYNGYKVYWEDGAQVTAPKDKEIIDEVKAERGISDDLDLNAEDMKKLLK